MVLEIIIGSFMGSFIGSIIASNLQDKQSEETYMLPEAQLDRMIKELEDEE